MTAAGQISHRVAFTCQLKFEERVQHRKLKSLASTLANAVLQFWSSVEVPRELEETSLGTDKVYDCLTYLSLMVLDGNHDHMVSGLSSFPWIRARAHAHTCVYVWLKS